MTQRVQWIISQIRLNLKEVSQQNVQNGDLLLRANQIQNQILLNTKCVEKEFTIYLVDGEQSYDFEDENTLDIKEILPSWNGEVHYIPNNKWNDYRNIEGSYPLWATIFGNKLYFSPTPSTDDSVTIWAYLTTAENEITEDYDPETPRYVDDAIIFGVCAYYEDKWEMKYREQLDLIIRRSGKTSKRKENYPDW